jgi:hypothetical protein
MTKQVAITTNNLFRFFFFFPTTTNSMKCLVNWIPPNTHVRFEKPNPALLTLAEKDGDLQNLVQNWSIGSIVGARPTAAPRNGRRDNVEGY